MEEDLITKAQFGNPPSPLLGTLRASQVSLTEYKSRHWNGGNCPLTLPSPALSSPLSSCSLNLEPWGQQRKQSEGARKRDPIPHEHASHSPVARGVGQEWCCGFPCLGSAGVAAGPPSLQASGASGNWSCQHVTLTMEMEGVTVHCTLPGSASGSEN